MWALAQANLREPRSHCWGAGLAKEATFYWVILTDWQQLFLWGSHPLSHHHLEGSEDVALMDLVF